MKFLLLSCCLALLAMIGTVQGADVLAGMEAKYDAKRAEIDQIRDKVAKDALTELKSLLDSLEKKYTEKGNLEGVVAVRKAREYSVSLDAGIPDEAIPATGPLSEILQHYIQKKNQAEQTHLSSNVALTRAYLSALDRMKEGFTKQSRIEEAMTVSVEIERFTEREPDLVAKVRGEAAALAASAATQSRKGIVSAPQQPAGPTAGKPWTSPSGIEFVYIPPGTFTMGSPEAEKDLENDESPHRVTLTKGCWLGKYEVTQKQWEAVMGSNPSAFKGEDLPVEKVSWEDCQAFIKKLCQKEGVPPESYRLPTEAEWEYVCRAGTTAPSVGNLDDMGWYKGNSGGKTHPVGQKKPNAWGLFDMHGNVWEWCQDWFGAYPSGAMNDSAGPGLGSSRVHRGGSWHDSAGGCRSAVRSRYEPGNRGFNLGFRLLRMDLLVPNAQ